MRQYRYLVVGAGKMGRAVAYDLLQQEDTAGVTLLDKSMAVVSPVLSELNHPLVSGLAADIRKSAPEDIVRGYDAVIGCASYDFNVVLAEACIRNGVHFCDLGGNNDVVAAQFAMDADARARKVRIVPDCGIAPGAVSVIAQMAVERFQEDSRTVPNFLHIRVGGLPQEPTGALKYAKVFSVRGLINECTEPVEILRYGKRELVEPMTGLENQFFDAPWGKLEAAYTSGGSSTLTQTYEGIIDELDYKTLRFPGHWAIMNAMRELGFWSRFPIVGEDFSVRPRALTEALLEERLPVTPHDALLSRVVVGLKDEQCTFYDLIALADPKTSHTAMQRTTAYSAAIVARMLARGDVSAVGVLRQEQAIPAERFLDEWAKRGLILQVRHAMQLDTKDY